MARLIIFAIVAILSIVPSKALASYVKVRAIDCVATAYTHAEDECGRSRDDPNFGITASGDFVRRGFIAVDPKVIPLHSIVYIGGTRKHDGLYIAKDTGGAIKGNKVDIYVSDKAEAWEFGRQNVKIIVLREGEVMPFKRFYPHKGFTDVKLPERKTKYSAGYDFYLNESVTIPPHSIRMGHSGVSVEMQEDEYLLIANRSSLCKLGLMLANNVAIIDADYTGEIMLPLYNFTDEAVTLDKGERVAQGIFNKYLTIGDIVQTVRTGGFGSTN